MTFNEFMMSVLKSEKPAEQRYGQWAFNMLSDVRPELANRMVNSDSDPFNNDNNLQAFWAFLAENWS